MRILVDFADQLDHMLDELEETYNGRILSPQGKVIRVMPMMQRIEEEGGTWIVHGHIYVTTIMEGEIFQALLETAPTLGLPEPDGKWKEARKSLDELTEEIERKIRERGFMIQRGRYHFGGGEAEHRLHE